VIEEASRLGVFRLVLSGGEPTLREDIVELLDCALKSRVGRVFLSTNGLSVLARQINRLAFGQDRLTFKISLDGVAAVHDEIRGHPGASGRALAAISQLVSAGFEVYVTTTLMKANLHGLGGLLERVARTGCRRHYVVEVIPVGRALPELALSPQDREKARGVLRRFAHGRKGCALVAKLPFGGKRGSGLHCGGGTDECGVLAGGQVVACRLMPDLVEANVRERSLIDVWNDPTSFRGFRRPDLRKLNGPCRGCGYCRTCFAGCHAYARAASGNFFAADPRCPRVHLSSAGGPRRAG
jgi:radical SAM protein with 4Fe4S-binding SPASM domain